MDGKNKEGYLDPTVAKAIQEADRPPELVSWYIQTVKALAEIFDLQIVGRIRIKDKRSGKVYE